jgi:hypothetical protein
LVTCKKKLSFENEFAVLAGGVAGCAPPVSHSVLRVLIQLSVGWRLSRVSEKERLRESGAERGAMSRTPSSKLGQRLQPKPLRTPTVHEEDIKVFLLIFFPACNT